MQLQDIFLFCREEANKQEDEALFEEEITEELQERRLEKCFLKKYVMNNMSWIKYEPYTIIHKWPPFNFEHVKCLQLKKELNSKKD